MKDEKRPRILAAWPCIVVQDMTDAEFRNHHIREAAFWIVCIVAAIAVFVWGAVLR